MSSRQRRARTLGRALLYTVALCGGAAVAELTIPGPAHSVAAEAISTSALREVDATANADPNVDVDVDEPVALAAAVHEHAHEDAHEQVDGDGREIDAEPLDALGAELKDGMIIGGGSPHRLILFTFDDGPDVQTTPLLLDRLDAVGVKAVFFLTANKLTGGTPILRQQAALAREIVERGHMVGNHTVDHVQMPLLDDERAKLELVHSEEIFERVFGRRPWLFRPPFGAHSERIDFYVAARGYTTVLWNLGAGDFQVRTAQEVFELWRRVFERREREHGERGGIVLLHDTYPWSIDAFQLIHAHLMERNCELLAEGEELFDIVDDPRWFHVPRGDAPPSTIAPGAVPPEGVLEARQHRLREQTRERCRSLASL